MNNPANYTFNPEDEKEKLENSGDEIIPEGKQLFILNNLYFGKYDANPKGKRRDNDFIWYLYPTFVHHDTGLILRRFDNGNEGTWSTVLKLERVGSPQINTHPMFAEFMEKLDAPKIVPDPAFPKSIRYWSINERGQAVFNGYDETPAGPLGLPLVLNVLHKEVGKMEAKRDRDGNVVKQKNQKGYEYTVLIPSLDPKTGVQLKETKAFIECLPIPENVDPNGFGVNDYRWPKLYDLPEKAKDVRGSYSKPGDKDDSMSKHGMRDDGSGSGADNEIDW